MFIAAPFRAAKLKINKNQKQKCMLFNKESVQ